MRAMCRAGEDGWHLVVVRLILHYAHVMQVIIPRTFHLVPLIELRPTDEKAREGGRLSLQQPWLSHTTGLPLSISRIYCRPPSAIHLPFISQSLWLINFRALSVELIATLGKNERLADGTAGSMHTPWGHMSYSSCRSS